VLGQVIARAVASRALDGIVVATTIEARDDAVVEEAQKCHVEVFRGSENDVLDRYHQAALYFGADAVVRITSDCPLLDSHLLGAMVAEYREARRRGICLDYFSNTIQRTFPQGFDIEIVGFAALERACLEAEHSEEREHVTPYLYRHPEMFTIAQHVQRNDQSSYRLTLDTPEDYRLIQQLYAELEDGVGLFPAQRAVALLAERPDLRCINANIKQRTI
jgi:spore coat polysaccharide biosynthesis protein SpsF